MNVNEHVGLSYEAIPAPLLAGFPGDFNVDHSPPVPVQSPL